MLATDLTLYKTELELENIDFETAFEYWDNYDRWA